MLDLVSDPRYPAIVIPNRPEEVKMTSSTATPTALRRAIERAEADRDSARDDVAREIRRVRDDLDRAEQALVDGFRVPASATGHSFVSSTSRDLDKAIGDLRKAEDTLTLLNRLRAAEVREAEFDVVESYGPDAEDCIHSAIVNARITGSVGATSSREGEGIETSSATVRRSVEATS